jgi:hypothetical protein
MKDFDVREVFCEILGGALFLSLLIAIFDFCGLIDTKALTTALAPKITLGVVTAGLTASYLVGILVDAMGLALGECFVDDWINSKSKTITSPAFWKTVPEHVLKYRDLQWTYYSTYRNVLLLLVPGLVVFPKLVYARLSSCWSAGAVLLILFLMWSLWRSARSLLELYYKIPTHFAP